MKSGDFRCRGATFHPGNFDIPSTVDVAIMRRPALITSPLPHSKRTRPFGLLAGMHPQTEHFGNCTARQRRASHRLSQSTCTTACCGASTSRRRARTSPFPCLRMPHGTVRRHVEETPTPVGDFRHGCANLLPAPLKHSELFLLLPVEFWRCNPLARATTLFRPRSMPREGVLCVLRAS
jgi:hypothetical protein